MKKRILVISLSVIFSILFWIYVSLAGQYYTSIEVPVRLVNFPPGYTSSNYSPDKVTFKIKGTGLRLFEINLGGRHEFIIPVDKDSGRKVLNVSHFIPENQWLTSRLEVTDFYPSQINYNVERVASKYVKISPVTELSFKTGYGLASNIKLFPDTARIFGGHSVIRHIDSLVTEKLKLTDLDDKYTENVVIREIPGLETNIKNVRVELDVQQIVDKKIDFVNVELTEVPHDKLVLLLPNKISIGIRGGIDYLGKLNSGNIKATVSYRDIIVDTLGSVPVKLDLPENIKLIYTDPERIKYIIKKYR